MNIIHECRRILEGADFETTLSQGDQDIVYFENSHIYGFVWNASTISELLSFWEQRQDSFLRMNALRLRGGGQKTWNGYSIVLTADRADGKDRMNLVEIEEDLRATRKIARSGVATIQDALDCLLPILPIQKASSQADYGNAEGSVKDKLKSFPQVVVDAVLSNSTAENQWRVLGRAYENKKD